MRGVLNVVNSYVAKNHIKNISKTLHNRPCETKDIDFGSLSCSKKLEYEPVMELDDDFDKAMEMMDELEKIYDSLPQLDCGSSGAPSCKALAEDIVRGFADESFCIVNMKAKVQELATELLASDKDNREEEE